MTSRVHNTNESVKPYRKTFSGGYKEHNSSSRIHLVWTSTPMLFAAIHAFCLDFYLIGIVTTILTCTSTLYHWDNEGKRFASLDKAFCIIDAIIVQFYAALCPLDWQMAAVWVFWFSGVVCWKKGHKCRCVDRSSCGHPYRTGPLLFHIAWHFIAMSSIMLVVHFSSNTWRSNDFNCLASQSMSSFGRFLFGASNCQFISFKRY